MRTTSSFIICDDFIFVRISNWNSKSYRLIGNWQSFGCVCHTATGIHLTCAHRSAREIVCKRRWCIHLLRWNWIYSMLRSRIEQWPNSHRDRTHCKWGKLEKILNFPSNDYVLCGLWRESKYETMQTYQMHGGPCGTENLQNDHWLVKYFGNICRPCSLARVSSMLKIWMVPWSDDTQIRADDKLKLMQNILAWKRVAKFQWFCPSAHFWSNEYVRCVCRDAVRPLWHHRLYQICVWGCLVRRPWPNACLVCWVQDMWPLIHVRLFPMELVQFLPSPQSVRRQKYRTKNIRFQYWDSYFFSIFTLPKRVHSFAMDTPKSVCCCSGRARTNRMDSDSFRIRAIVVVSLWM